MNPRITDCNTGGTLQSRPGSVAHITPPWPVALGSQADRARRGGSGALHPQSALAGLNSLPRGSAPVAPPFGASMVRVPRGVGLRIRSGPEGSSLKRPPAGAAGVPGPEPWTRDQGARGWILDAGCTVRSFAPAEHQPGAVAARRPEPGRDADRFVGVLGGEDVFPFDLFF